MAYLVPETEPSVRAAGELLFAALPGAGEVAARYRASAALAAGLTDVAFSPGGALLATGSWDRTVALWEY